MQSNKAEIQQNLHETKSLYQRLKDAVEKRRQATDRAHKNIEEAIANSKTDTINEEQTAVVIKSRVELRKGCI